MKTSRVYLLVIATLVGGALLLGRSFAQSAAPGSEARVAVCDVVKVFNSYDRAEDLTAQLNERRNGIKAEAERRSKAIQAIQMEMEGLVTGSTEYEQRFNDIQRLTIDRAAWLKFEEARALRDHHRLTREMYEEIVEVIGKTARQRGVDIVLYRMSAGLQSENTPQLLQEIERRKVLYAADRVDLTDAIMKRLNDSYRAKKK